MAFSISPHSDPPKMKRGCIIIGGGIAGLTAAIKLTQKNITPILIDAGSYPSHKVCGEFLSPEAIPLLLQLGIAPSNSVKKVVFHIEKDSFEFCFKTPAGSISRYHLDAALLEKAQNLGVCTYLNTRVENIQQQGDSYTLCLNTGEKIIADQLIVSTGRATAELFTKTVFSPKYIGFKAHFANKGLNNDLNMHLFPGGYFGVVNIDHTRTNVAGLIKKTHFRGDIKTHIAPFFKGDLLFNEWIQVPVPAFGLQQRPNLQQIYFIGDGAATIPPICGSGLSLSLHSGFLAAEYIAKRDDKGFKKAWKKHFFPSIFWGRCLHQLALNPHVSKHLLQTTKKWPYLFETIFKRTRPSSLLF